MILHCLRICPYPVNIFVLLSGTSLLCTNMAHKLCTGYVHTLHTMQSKPSSASDCPCDPHTYGGVHPPRFHSYILYRCDDSTLSATTSQLPFNYSRNTVRRFHGYHFMQFRGCLWRFWLRWCPSANLQIATLWRLCGCPLMILRKSFDDPFLWRIASVLPPLATDCDCKTVSRCCMGLLWLYGWKLTWQFTTIFQLPNCNILIM